MATIVENNEVVDYPVAEGTTIIGMFKDGEAAEHAYNALRERGYNTKDINLVMTDETRKKYYSHGKTEIGTKAMAGAGTGSAIGAVVGAAAGVLAAIGTSIIIPGLGLVLAGPIAAGIAGAGAGGITGGIIGALVGAGIPEERARIYESGIKKGNIMIAVRPRTDEDAAYIENEWRHYGEEVHR
jgi:hypothetical protein